MKTTFMLQSTRRLVAVLLLIAFCTSCATQNCRENGCDRKLSLQTLDKLLGSWTVSQESKNHANQHLNGQPHIPYSAPFDIVQTSDTNGVYYKIQVPKTSDANLRPVLKFKSIRFKQPTNDQRDILKNFSTRTADGRGICTNGRQCLIGRMALSFHNRGTGPATQYHWVAISEVQNTDSEECKYDGETASKCIFMSVFCSSKHCGSGSLNALMNLRQEELITLEAQHLGSGHAHSGG